jgi:phosphatidylserine/phosphatidylglycerophosphate/cardiolipin synthase-like enzyme
MAAALKPIVRKGKNCWRVERAEKASVIVDAADYYAVAQSLMEEAERRIFIVGWDFDTRIAMRPDTDGKGEELGKLLLRLAEQKPKLQIDILKWNFGALKQFFRPRAVMWLWHWWRQKNIDMRLDSSHPFGCSHHQKILVIDDDIAACGGIDISTHRWDTPDHKDGDPHRTGPDGKPYTPWHDATMLMKGDVASALGELGRERWKNATRRALPPIEPADDDWPDDLEPMFENVDIAIARTRAEYDGREAIREVEAMWLDMVCAASDFLYIENQYFTSAKVASAIAARMQEKKPPEIVMVMPHCADGWLEQQAMDGARAMLIKQIGSVDAANRFRVYMPVTKKGQGIYVHAKLSVMDDRLLRVGSANLNNRSFGLDSECDVVIDAARAANKNTGPAMTALRHRLLAEHLDVTPAAYGAAEQKHGSMIAAIEALRGKGKTLKPLPLEDFNDAQKFVADNQLMDPEHPDGFLDPVAGGTLSRNWRRGRNWARGFRRR